MFNVNTALAHMPDLTKAQALEWAKQANKFYKKYTDLNFVASQARNGAIKDANKAISQKYGVKSR